MNKDQFLNEQGTTVFFYKHGINKYLQYRVLMAVDMYTKECKEGIRRTFINLLVIGQPSKINKSLYWLVNNGYIDKSIYKGYDIYNLSVKSSLLLGKYDNFIQVYKRDFFVAFAKFRGSKKEFRDLFYHSSYGRDIEI